MNCTSLIFLDSSNKLLDTTFVKIINKLTEWNWVHSNYPAFGYVIFLQISASLLSPLENISRVNTKFVFFIYLIYITVIGLGLWEFLEVFTTGVGDFLCSVTTCIPLIKALTWFGESKLGSYLDMHHGIVCCLFISYAQYKSKILFWPKRSTFQAIKRFFVLLLLGLWGNVSTLFYKINTCNSSVSEFWKTPFNIIPIGIYICLAGFLLTMYFMEQEDIQLEPKMSQKIKKFYNTWRIYHFIQLLFCSWWQIGTTISIHIAWVVLGLMCIIAEKNDIWW